MVPFQQPGAPEAHGLTAAQCEEALWAATSERNWYRGAAAINTALAVALGTRLPLQLYRIPGMKQLQDRAYAWVARNRCRLPGDKPYCRQPPAECR